jgi:LysM repeat protein
MRWRVLFFVSLGVNLALAIGWLAAARRAGSSGASPIAEPALTPLVKTNVVVRRQFFSWQQLESADYPIYIANLRDIGCPEQTIRDIIIADVNALYAKRRASEIITPQQQWWRSEPDPVVTRIANEKFRVLDKERRTLLAKLLGTDWEGGDLATLPRPSRPGVVLDGPVLGVLPVETKQAIESLSIRAEDRMQAYLDSVRASGKNPDPAELARLREQTRNELAGVLSPQQLEEYLLRYSQDANNLRSELGQLKFFNATPDEFRSIFRATDSIDQQLQALAGSIDPNSVAQRAALEQQRENSLKLALGPERYEQYRLLHDPAYQQAFVDAQAAGDPTSAATLYQINLATLAEQNQLRTNSVLTDEQKSIALKQIELDHMKALAEATGQELPPEPPPVVVPSTQPATTHVIRNGESVATISFKYGLPVSVIRAANPNLDFNQLKPGDSIRIPQFNQPPIPVP